MSDQNSESLTIPQPYPAPIPSAVAAAPFAGASTGAVDAFPSTGYPGMNYASPAPTPAPKKRSMFPALLLGLFTGVVIGVAAGGFGAWYVINYINKPTTQANATNSTNSTTGGNSTGSGSTTSSNGTSSSSGTSSGTSTASGTASGTNSGATTPVAVFPDSSKVEAGFVMYTNPNGYAFESPEKLPVISTSVDNKAVVLMSIDQQWGIMYVQIAPTGQNPYLDKVQTTFSPVQNGTASATSIGKLTGQRTQYAISGGNSGFYVDQAPIDATNSIYIKEPFLPAATTESIGIADLDKLVKQIEASFQFK